MASDTFPPQGWAHAKGRICLSELQPADWSPAALAARAQIADVLYRFVTARDETRADVAASCFLPDGVLEATIADSAPTSEFSGRSEIADRFERMRHVRKDQRRHIMSNVMVDQLDVERGTATAISSCAVSAAADGISMVASVIYSARLRRDDDGCWRFERLILGLDHYEGPRFRVLDQADAN